LLFSGSSFEALHVRCYVKRALAVREVAAGDWFFVCCF
jgi:hypothetical protein